MTALSAALGPDDTLDVALGRLVDAGMSWLPVLDGGRARRPGDGAGHLPDLQGDAETKRAA